MDFIKIKRFGFAFVLLLIVMAIGLPLTKSEAGTATAVSIGTIDYDKLTMQVNYNSNTLIYYSTDNSTWTEVEGAFDSNTNSCVMDISWIPSKNETTLYFKGNVAKTVKSVTLPVQNTTFKVEYDKAEGEFTFSDAEESDTFEWRKSTDYSWTEVDMDEDSSSYKDFIKTMESFRLKGAKIVIRLPQVIGTGIDDVGIRPSKEATVSITVRGEAPSIKVNSVKLTLSTTTSMEYYDAITGLWLECSSSMTLDEITPKVLFENGSKPVTLKIRKAATSSAPYSKTTEITIPGQQAAPTIGDSNADVTYYYLNSKLVLQFNNASTKNVYQYAVVKEGYDFEIAKASWKDVSNNKLMTLSGSATPEGCRIYVRKKGTDAGTNTSLVLSSATNSFKVEYK